MTNNYKRPKCHDEDAAEAELDELIKNAEYDRQPYPEIDFRDEEPPFWLTRAVGIFLLACLLVIAGSITYAIIRWVFFNN